MIEQQSTPWYQTAVDELTRIAAAVQREHDLDLKSVSSLASDIVESLGRNDQLVVEALAGSNKSPLITNLVNVGILATKVGRGLGYDRTELERLALAGLVHDIGLLAVPQSLVTKAGRLTSEERILIEHHPELGYQALRKLGMTHDWLAEVVRQAHERWNGQGYPNKLKGRQITELAQIIGIVDVFDALVSPRPYRRRCLPHEAVRVLVAERTAFPRELVKVLVEQLSAYPIGTSVRLSTGELGTVTHVNTRFPLRPVVLIGDGQADDLGTRQIDLSTSPRVTIIETVAPPDVARLSFPIRALLPSVTEDAYRFPVVLSPRNRAALDAIANVIQEVVESVAPLRQGIDGLSEETMSPHRDAAVAELVNTSFEKEVVGLFVLEAQEWLAQMQRALNKLTEEEDHAIRSKLHGHILQAILNLAKSAAAVQLSAIEQMTMNLLPILHEVRRQEPRTASAALHWLHEGLARITTAVRRLTSDHADHALMPSSPPSLSNRQQVGTLQPVAQPSEASEPPLLKALRTLQQARGRSVQPIRDVLETVIQRIEHEAGEISLPVAERILKELHTLDEKFLEDVTRRVPVIIQALQKLRTQQTAGSVTASQLDPIVGEVDALYDLANREQISMMTMFLDGLRSFIRASASRKASTLRQWLEMVEARVQTLVPMAEQWVTIGRTERADLGEILRA